MQVPISRRQRDSAGSGKYLKSKRKKTSLAGSFPAFVDGLAASAIR
jgi:hypothetical protein